MEITENTEKVRRRQRREEGREGKERRRRGGMESEDEEKNRVSVGERKWQTCC